MIDVYTANTPNGVKVPIALEELGVPYRVIRINLGANEQKRPDFLRINPNGRIPAIVDPDGPGGAPLSVFESGAILWYLAEKFPGLMPRDPVERIRALEYTLLPGRRHRPDVRPGRLVHAPAASRCRWPSSATETNPIA